MIDQTSAVFAVGTTYDPTTLLIMVCIIAYTVLIGMAGYFFGRDDARIESDRFWAMQRLLKARSEPARYKRRSEAAKKGHRTRKRIDKRVAVLITGTECNR